MSLYPFSPALSVLVCDKLREMSSYVSGISVASDSQCYCSSISHHFIQFHGAEWDNIDIIHFFTLSPPTMNFTASQGFHRENSSVMDPNRGRHCTVLTYWKCKISYIHFCRWLPNYTLAVHVTCHLTAPVISLQQKASAATLLLDFTAMQIICCSCTALLSFNWLIYPIFMSAGITNSANLTSRRSFSVSFSFDPLYEY